MAGTAPRDQFDTGIHATATFGVATARYGESLDTMVDRVDKALYEGKRLGLDRVVASRPPVAALPEEHAHGGRQ